MYKTFELVNKFKNDGKIVLSLIRFLGIVLPRNSDLFSIAVSVVGLGWEHFQLNNINLLLETKAKNFSVLKSLKSVLNDLVSGVSP